MVQNNQASRSKYWAVHLLVFSHRSLTHSRAHEKVNDETDIFVVFFFVLDHSAAEIIMKRKRQGNWIKEVSETTKTKN